MRAMLLRRPRQPLEAAELPDPRPGPGEVLIRVGACGVCRTDLHVVDGELPHPRLPLVPGHEIVGRVLALGAGVDTLQAGQRVGVGWLGHACGQCEYCAEGRENLCDGPASPAIPATAASPSWPSPRRATPIPCPRPATTPSSPRCCAPA